MNNEVLTLSVALGVIVIGVVLLVVDLISRAKRRAAERPIDMSRFNQSVGTDSLGDVQEFPRKPRNRPSLNAPEPSEPSEPKESLPPIGLFAHVARMADAQQTGEQLPEAGAAPEPLTYSSAPFSAPEPLAYGMPEPAPFTPAEAPPYEPPVAYMPAEPPAFAAPEPVVYAPPEPPAMPEPVAYAPFEPAGVSEPEAAPASSSVPEPTFSRDSGLEAEASVYTEPGEDMAARPLFAEPAAPEPALPEPAAPQDEPAWMRSPIVTHPAPEPAPLLTPAAPAEEPAWMRSPIVKPPAPESVLTPTPAPEPVLTPAPVIAPATVAAPEMAPTPTQPVLTCRGYGAGFGSKIVLADINLELQPRGITTLMGPVGTGKSTLLRSLAGIYGQSTLYKNWGQAWYRGKPLALGNRPLLVAQRIQLTQRSALDSLTFHLRDQMEGASDDERRSWAADWLGRLGADYIIPMLDTSFIELEPVYQRAVTILREAAAETELLMIDEPTSGLSDKDANILLDLLMPLAERAALLVVLHNQRQARKISEKIILLAGGHVQIHTDTASFFANDTNPVVMQFVATGSCAVPAPDAPRETLAEHVTPPPPLTAEALAAIKSEIRSTLAPAAARPAPVAEQPAPVTPPPATAPTAATMAPPAPLPAVTPEPVAPAPVTMAPATMAPPAPAHTPASPPPAHVIAAPPEAAPSAPPAAPERVAVTRYPGASAGPRGFIWIEEGRLAATPMPGITTDVDYDLELLKGVGVTTLITLTEKDFPQEVLARHGLKNVHLPIADRKAPTPAEMDMLVVRMRELLDAGKVLAVHCLAGLGRTGTILAAYLVKEKGLSAQVALNQIRRFNRQFVQSDDQEDFLVEYEVQQEQNVLRNRATDVSKA